MLGIEQLIACSYRFLFHRLIYVNENTDFASTLKAHSFTLLTILESSYALFATFDFVPSYTKVCDQLVSFYCPEFRMCIQTKRGSGSSVGIATNYGLDGPGSIPGGDEICRSSRPALGPTQPPVKWVPGLSRGSSAAGACI